MDPEILRATINASMYCTRVLYEQVQHSWMTPMTELRRVPSEASFCVYYTSVGRVMHDVWAEEASMRACTVKLVSVVFMCLRPLLYPYKYTLCASATSIKQIPIPPRLGDFATKSAHPLLRVLHHGSTITAATALGSVPSPSSSTGIACILHQIRSTPLQPSRPHPAAPSATADSSHARRRPVRASVDGI